MHCLKGASMKRFIILLTIVLPLSLFLAACSNGDHPPQKNSNKLTIYTTVFPIQYFTEQIGDKYVDVMTIYPPGADEHTFEPSQKNMMNLADSDLFIYIGLGLEGFVEKAKQTLKNENVKLIPVAESLKLPKITTVKEDEDGHRPDVNPHVWLDPIYSKEMALIIKNELVKKMPKNKKTFNENYNKLAKELDDLNRNYQQTISHAKNKKVIVTHAAFGYWETRYGLKQISISGLSTTNEPTQKELEKIVSLAEKEGIHYILFEQNFNSKLGRIVQEEIGATALTIHNLSVLSPENLKNKETYFTLMNKNLETLKTAINK
jgi:zinc transport system substrate-binding protein